MTRCVLRTEADGKHTVIVSELNRAEVDEVLNSLRLPFLAEKVCVKCRKTKVEADFYMLDRRRGRRMVRCKECHRADMLRIKEKKRAKASAVKAAAEAARQMLEGEKG